MAGDGGGTWAARLGIERPEARAWALYDWANSAVYTTIVAAIFPVYFLEVAAAGMERDVAQQRYAWATAAAVLVIALVSPVLGTLADLRACKKRYLAVFAAVGILACCGLFFVGTGDAVAGLLLFALANLGVAGSVVFYDALLPHVARGDADKLSTTGFALGYLGGGLLLALNVLWIARPEWFGLPHGEGLSDAERTLPYRLAFLSVALWWGLFTLPLLLRVPEPPVAPAAPGEEAGVSLAAAFRRLGGTLRHLRRYRQALLMLVAFLIYSDGINTILRMAGIYAKGQEIGTGFVLGTLLLVQFVGVPFALLFGRLAARFGAQRMVVAGLLVYVGVCVFAFFMRTGTHFLLLGVLVGTVQGGCQALSRSMFAAMTPRHRSGEFFAFFSWSGKFAGLLGGWVFGLATGLAGDARPAILTIVPFFVLGAWLLARVDVGEGIRVAAAEDAALLAAAAPAPEPYST